MLRASLSNYCSSSGATRTPIDIVDLVKRFFEYHSALLTERASGPFVTSGELLERLSKRRA